MTLHKIPHIITHSLQTATRHSRQLYWPDTYLRHAHFAARAKSTPPRVAPRRAGGHACRGMGLLGGRALDSAVEPGTKPRLGSYEVNPK